MPSFNEFLSTVFWNNTGKEYLTAIGIFFAALIILKIFKIYVISALTKLAKKSKTKLDDILVDAWDTINPPFYFFIALYTSTRFLTLPEIPDRGIFYIFLTVVTYYVIRFIQKIIDYVTKSQIEKRRRENRVENTSMILTLGKLTKILLWTTAILILLSNLGVDITPLIAGLGVGGIAIAFALQNILEDLFSSFSIYFDAPFKEGDFIIIGKDMGIVKHIGIKTTRVQTLQGQELVISNRELTSTRINNYKKMENRRILFTFGVEYNTSTKKLKKINEIVKTIINKVEFAKLDRVHFKEFGDFSLNYEIVYYVSTGDYNKYMDTQEKINLALKEAFEKEGIEFAFPTQTINLNKSK